MHDEIVQQILIDVMELIAKSDENVYATFKKLQSQEFQELSKEEKKVIRKACRSAVDQMKTYVNYNLFSKYDEVTLDDFSN
jgi:TRAP-type mannitol/chloroaromatic compound transport system substrate-binding protein